MSDWPFGIPPIVIFVIVMSIVIFVLWLLSETLFALLKIVFHGIWVLFGGHPKSAPDRLKSKIKEGKGKGGMFWSAILFIATAIALLLLLILPLWTFLKYGLIIAAVAFLFAGVVYLLTKKAEPTVSTQQRRRSLKTRSLETYDKKELAHEVYRCTYCSNEIGNAFYTCFYCGAIFCNRADCTQKRRSSGKCPKCGRPLKTVYHILPS